MRTHTTILPGVKAIGYVNSDYLPRRIDLSAICRIKVPVLTEITPVDFFDSPECSCKTTREGAGFVDNASLKFTTPNLLPRRNNLAIVVTDTNGNSFIIGSKEHPLPVPEPTRRLGSPSGDAAGYLYEISHIALISLIPCYV